MAQHEHSDLNYRSVTVGTLAYNLNVFVVVAVAVAAAAVAAGIEVGIVIVGQKIETKIGTADTAADMTAGRMMVWAAQMMNLGRLARSCCQEPAHKDLGVDLAGGSHRQ
eukprot:CAMPEP_0179450882 /NCGR_PEP_ID=MMETSP0799-20121207/34904_1 /TAXON_ID=46947 /ORGANISM="Geminigera cryophila, Strain CCMP2564" /LENGTH=108 /DNA_ID=CAMNT_0021245521 /DNA_START=22 /DNA_END=348 /DNA_ORIENTATION=+